MLRKKSLFKGEVLKLRPYGKKIELNGNGIKKSPEIDLGKKLDFGRKIDLGEELDLGI